MFIILDADKLLVLRPIDFGSQVREKKSASFMSREQHDLEEQISLRRDPDSEILSEEITMADISLGLNLANLSPQSAVEAFQNLLTHKSLWTITNSRRLQSSLLRSFQFLTSHHPRS